MSSPERHEAPSLGERLLDPACYRHPVEEIRLVETHISWVLLTGRYAYKVKKPLRLPFLDFSSAAARRRFCDEELRVNRRLAPDLYLDVVPIAGSPAAPLVGGEGTPFEHAVRMVQFDDGSRLDRLLDAGRLDAARLREAGSLVARFHAAADAAPPTSRFASPERVAAESLDNFDALAGAGDPAMLARLRAWTAEGLERLEAVLAARRGAGRVRECHGDLHLENLALWRGRVLAFDALEFDEDLRWIDVMSEVAFTVMDLLHRERPDLAFAFLDAYLELGGDFQGLAVLRHYLVYRALVRAKIAAIDAGAAGTDVARRAQARRRCDALVALAARLALDPPAPMLVATHGVSGSGKSRLAAELLAPLAAVRVRSDVERARLFEPGPLRYAEQATARLYEHLARCAGDALGAGWPVIVDATCLERRWRALLADTAAQHGAGFALLACDADPATLRARVAARAASAADASEATVEVLERQLAARAPLDGEERARCVEVDTAAAPPPAEVAARLRATARAPQEARR